MGSKTKSDTTKGEFKQIYLQEKREKRRANPTEILSDPLHRHSYQNNNFLYLKVTGAVSSSVSSISTIQTISNPEEPPTWNWTGGIHGLCNLI